MKEKIKENTEKIKLNKQLPYLVGNVVEASAGDGVLVFPRDFLTFCALFCYSCEIIRLELSLVPSYCLDGREERVRRADESLP